MFAKLTCRSCGGSDIRLILSLGQTPLANALLTSIQLNTQEDVYPLELFFCLDCGLVQISETVPPEKLFHEYSYFSSSSISTLQQANNLANRIIEQQGLHENSLVIEIASNDGYLLQFYRQRGIPVLGVEPAKNIARVAQEEKSIPTVCEFFDEQLAVQFQDNGFLADVIHAHNVLAHVKDLNGFVRGVYTLLKENGLAIVEVPYVKHLIEKCQFDTIYHEHLCYFSLIALENLFKRHNLNIIRVEDTLNQGGSLRLFITKHRSPTIDASFQSMLDKELNLGLGKIAFYRDFSIRVDQICQPLKNLLHNIKSEGKSIAAYGASAKGTTLLTYCKIGKDSIDFIVDNITYKQGKFTPGTHIPVYKPSILLDKMPNYVLILAWNVADEIMAREAVYIQRGGRFIIPIPYLQVYGE